MRLHYRDFRPSSLASATHWGRPNQRLELLKASSTPTEATEQPLRQTMRAPSVRSGRLLRAWVRPEERQPTDMDMPPPDLQTTFGIPAPFRSELTNRPRCCKLRHNVATRPPLGCTFPSGGDDSQRITLMLPFASECILWQSGRVADPIPHLWRQETLAGIRSSHREEVIVERKRSRNP